MSTKDYKTPNEIEIRVKAGNRAEVDRGKKKKGAALPGKKKRRFLHRRNAARGFEFYDLGQKIAGGIWQTNTFTITPTLVFSGSPPGFSPDLLTLDGMRDLENLILATPAANLSATFRKVKKSAGSAFPLYVTGETFAISSFDDLDYWTDNGLELTNEQLHGSFLAVGSYNDIAQRTFFTRGIEINDPASRKVTALPSFDAPEVPFVINPKAKIFLMPWLNYHFGLSNSGSNRVVYNAMYRLRPRDFDNPFAVFEYNQGSPYDETLFNEAFARSSALTPTRTTTISGGVLIPGGTFPTGDPGFEVDNKLLFDVPPVAMDGYVGALTGIIQQVGSTFYIWQSS